MRQPRTWRVRGESQSTSSISIDTSWIRGNAARVVGVTRAYPWEQNERLRTAGKFTSTKHWQRNTMGGGSVRAIGATMTDGSLLDNKTVIVLTDTGTRGTLQTGLTPHFLVILRPYEGRRFLSTGDVVGVDRSPRNGKPSRAVQPPDHAVPCKVPNVSA
jgi:hypothetical protein